MNEAFVYFKILRVTAFVITFCHLPMDTNQGSGDMSTDVFGLFFFICLFFRYWGTLWLPKIESHTLEKKHGKEKKIMDNRTALESSTIRKPVLYS